MATWSQGGRRRLVAYAGVTLAIGLVAACVRGEERGQPRPPPLPAAEASAQLTIGAPGEWVRVRAGAFVMGSPEVESGLDDEAPHQVTLTHDYFIQATEVTQGQFQDVMGYNPSQFASCGRDCPVEKVTWDEAAAYCARLSEREGIEPCYSCSGSGREVRCEPSDRWRSPYHCPGYRLPTEAEWEYAARAASTASAHGDVDEVAWYEANANRTTQEVGTLRPNAWGLFDSLGNVAEWCHDLYGDYPTDATDPWGAAEGLSRVIRGSSWMAPARDIRFGVRGSFNMERFSNYDLGFRPSRSVPGEEVAPPPPRSPAASAQAKVRAPGEWVRIGAGSFTMGSPPDEPGRDRLEALHQVTLTHDYFIQATEVTQGQFQDVMGYTPSQLASCGPDCPVESVTWHEATAYCNRLSEREGLPPCFSCSGSGDRVSCETTSPHGSPYLCRGYRLPTEAEWEYAARAGTKTAVYDGPISILEDGTASALDPIAWYGGNSSVSYEGGERCPGYPPRPDRCGPHPVKQKRANGWGLYDLLGNVAEWCHDGHGDYPAEATDPWGVARGADPVIRGGSWQAPPDSVRAAARSTAGYEYSSTDRGFRCARSN